MQLEMIHGRIGIIGYSTKKEGLVFDRNKIKLGMTKDQL
jgi:hypothetical protein